MPSKRSYFFRHLLKAGVSDDKSIDVLRAKIVKDTRFPKPPKDIHIAPTSIAGIPGEWVTPGSLIARNRIMIYLHGGGYVVGSPATHRNFVARLAKACGIRALSVDYRLAPEHPFPAALEDSLAVYHQVLDHGIAPENIVLAGDSAGSGLALATLISLRDNQHPLPAMSVCISPWTDLALTGESIETCAGIDPYISYESLILNAHYLGGNDPKSPLISPLYADFTGIPPLLIHVGTDEVLLSDSTRLAERAKASGGDVQIKVWERMWHDFHMWAPYLPEANLAIDEIARYVKNRWHCYG
jgi:monoterpene epsilon-lactone hydrolase